VFPKNIVLIALLCWYAIPQVGHDGIGALHQDLMAGLAKRIAHQFQVSEI